MFWKVKMATYASCIEASAGVEPTHTALASSPEVGAIILFQLIDKGAEAQRRLHDSLVYGHRAGLTVLL